MIWCTENNIEISRSRSYHKNDNGYIEQRNGQVERRWFGYDRLGNIKLLPRIQKMCEKEYGKIVESLEINLPRLRIWG